MKSIADLCRPFGVSIIEDASHALGGRYDNEPVGACVYSDATVFSFHPVKPVTSGEGGMITCNDLQLAKRARLYASHGIERDNDEFISEKTGAWYYEQQVLGFNYRLSDIHSALGLSQMRRVDEMVLERSVLADRYRNSLAHLPVKLLRIDAYEQSAWHLFVIRVDAGKRKGLFDHLRLICITCRSQANPIMQNWVFKPPTSLMPLNTQARLYLCRFIVA